MSLIEILRRAHSSIDGYRIDQILAMCGGGRLLDGSEASLQFTAYLGQIPIEKLAKHIDEVLGASFQDGGFVLQDLVNEVGRRLGFQVSNGRYRGVINKSGHDGLWEADGSRLIIEVKTTDAYRINISTLARYALSQESIDPSGPSGVQTGILIVVGRQDTGDLEAQIRGSRYAWDVRLISAESLIEVARLRQIAVDKETEVALRRALMPLELTRVDNLVTLLSRIALDAERYIQVEQDEVSQAPLTAGKEGASIDVAQIASNVVPLEMRRAQILEACVEILGGALLALPRGKARYLGPNNEQVFVTLSRHYPRDYQHYWYAFQESWVEALSNAKTIVCLGMQDQQFFLKLPSDVLREALPLMNKTEKPGQNYWHLSLVEKDGGIFLPLPKAGKLQELTEYKAAC